MTQPKPPLDAGARRARDPLFIVVALALVGTFAALSKPAGAIHVHLATRAVEASDFRDACASFSYPSEARGAALVPNHRGAGDARHAFVLCRAAELASSVGTVACPHHGGLLAWVAGPELCGADLPAPSRADCPGAGRAFPRSAVAVVSPDPGRCDLSRIWFADRARAFAEPSAAVAFVLREASDADASGGLGAAGTLAIVLFVSAAVAAWVSGMIHVLSERAVPRLLAASRGEDP